MEVRIRLQRIGKPSNKRHNYRIVALPREAKRDSKTLDFLGYYDPTKKPAVVSLDQEKLAKWIKQGARMTNTVRSLAKSLKKA